ALTVQAFAGGGPVWLLYVLVAVESLLNAVNGPARRTFLPRLLPADRLPAGAALTMLAMHASVTAGPLLAGALAATLGLRACYLTDTISFAAALYAPSRLPPMPPATDESGTRSRPGLRSVTEALAFIRRDRVLTGAFLADTSATVLGMPFALFPAL